MAYKIEVYIPIGPDDDTYPTKEAALGELNISMKLSETLYKQIDGSIVEITEE